MNRTLKQFIALCLCFAMVAGFIPAVAPTVEADAAMYTSYTTIAKIGTHGGCNAMQGMDVDGTYIYCAKIDSDTEKTCAIGRIHKTTGDTVWLTNSATGTYYFSQLAHANDVAICTVNSVKTLFVGTGGAGMGDYSLVRFSFNGTTLTEVGHYNMKYNGAEKYIAGVKVVATSSTDITLVLKSGNYVFTAKIPYNASSGDIAMNYLGKLDFSAVNFNGTIKDISHFVVQGFGYKDNKLFVPMTANYQTSTSHISTIVCFDIDGMKGGNLKPDPNMSVWIEDTTYPDLFEIESCGISPTDGKLYFATNGRKSSTDGNHDGVHVLNGFVYNPAMGDSSAGYNYYFHTSSNKLQSVTTANSVFNSALQHLGTVSGSKISGGRWSLDMPIILKHSDPWIITWEASNWSGNSLLLSTYDTSSFANNYYLYRRSGNGLVALGYYGSGQYNNYGLMLSDHGIDDTVNHKYQLKNEVNSDGTNMVYLWVDGTKLGAMNNYYVGSTSQNKTDNWVSGKDFSFSYLGTNQHMVSGTLKYLKVWTQGNINAFDEPNIFRWETQSNTMTSISQFGYTNNAVTTLGGSCTDDTFSGYYAQLAQPVVLMHNRPWVVEWKTPSWSGNTMLFSSGDTALKLNASYLYRSTGIVAFGYSDGSKCHSYGLKLADFGLSATDGHTYRLTNKIAADGSNMIYLSVDGTELGAMNKYYLGNDYQGTTSDFVNGKDFTFPYLGNYHYGLNQSYNYIQVWENGLPSEGTPNKYRWEASGSTFKNITTGYTANAANRVVGTLSGGVFNEASYRLDTPIVLLHNKPWRISWKGDGVWSGNAGGAFLFSASQKATETNAPYLYRRKESQMIGIGAYNGSKHYQYGLTLSDYGIDGTAEHTYTLTNKIAADGSNMVYLSVDGKELGAMNQVFIGAAATGSTSNWISGKDFTFSYFGTPRFPLANMTMDYLEINEGVTDTGTVVFKDWDGTVLSSKEYNIGDTVTPPANPTRPAEQGVVYTFAGWDKAVTSCQGDAVYTATYTSSAIDYTITFKDYDGTVISSATYNYGDSIAAPANPTREADQMNIYTFAGWDKPVTTCKGDAVFTATYNTIAISYTVTFVDYDGTEISSGTYHYGDTITVPADPTRSAYTFAGWSPAVTACSGNQVYTATYTAKGNPTITPTRPTVSFKDEVQLNVYFICENLGDVALEDMGMLTWANAQENGTIETADTVTPGAIINGSEYTVHTGGISAKNMGNTIFFKVYARLSDGTYIYSEMLSYSIKTYALQQISTSTNQRVRALCVALLNYGAEAQTYFNYKPYALMNSSLTAEQQALVSSYDESMVDPIVTAATSKTVNFTKNGGLSNFYPSVSFEGAFAINYYAVPTATPSGNVTLYYWYQDAYESANALTIANASGAVTMELVNGKYVGKVAGIVARKLDSTLYVSLVYTSGNTTYCSGVISYSVGRYLEQIAADSTNTAQPLGAAAAVYGYYAKEYFASLA